jgi:hypothetical protein
VVASDALQVVRAMKVMKPHLAMMKRKRRRAEEFVAEVVSFGFSFQVVLVLKLWSQDLVLLLKASPFVVVYVRLEAVAG